VHLSMKEDTGTSSLQALPHFEAIVEADMQHGSFMRFPGWAIERDLCMAGQELERLRVLRDASSLCDLLKRGILSCTSPAELTCLNKGRYNVFTRHRRPNLSPKKGWTGRGADKRPGTPGSSASFPDTPMSTASNRSLSSVASLSSTTSASSGMKGLDTKLEFWMGLVTLWLLAFHLYARPTFMRRMQAIALPNELLHQPTKDFPTVMAFAREKIEAAGFKAWGDQVLAPLWAVDILSCCFEAESAERASAIEAALDKTFPVVRRQNCYDDEDSALYHKISLLMESQFTTLGTVRVLVEVNIYLVAHAAVNKKLDVVRSATSGKL